MDESEGVGLYEWMVCQIACWRDFPRHQSNVPFAVHDAPQSKVLLLYLVLKCTVNNGKEEGDTSGENGLFLSSVRRVLPE